jgi:hypothetical protein
VNTRNEINEGFVVGNSSNLTDKERSEWSHGVDNHSKLKVLQYFTSSGHEPGEAKTRLAPRAAAAGNGYGTEQYSTVLSGCAVFIDALLGLFPLHSPLYGVSHTGVDMSPLFHCELIVLVRQIQYYGTAHQFSHGVVVYRAFCAIVRRFLENDTHVLKGEDTNMEEGSLLLLIMNCYKGLVSKGQIRQSG